MARALVKHRSKTPSPISTASEALADYEQWLLAHYGKVGTYSDHAKSFLKHFREKGSLLSQLETFASKKSITGRSILNRFRRFLEEKKISAVQNDFKRDASSVLPRSNALVKMYLVLNKDRFKSKQSLSTYATILNSYFAFIGDTRHLEKITAERFIFSKNKSEFTSALYGSVLRSFATWALGYVMTPDSELSSNERKIKAAFANTSVRYLRDIVLIRTKIATKKLYYKESLTSVQRDKLLKACPTSKERSIIALMAYNGLRAIEIERLTVKDLDLSKRTIAIWGKGRSGRHKEAVVLFKIVAGELRAYLKDSKIKSGPLFPGLTYKKLHVLVMEQFIKINLPLSKALFSPHSLRHTAGQLLYDKGVPIEFIQRTLRHTSMQSTLVYAQKAIERSYFKEMKKF